MSITDPMRQFDSRTVRRKIKSGRISDAEYTEFLAELPDLSGNIRARDDGGDDDGYEERIANRGRPREVAAAPVAHAPVFAPRPAPPAVDDDPFADPPAASAPAPAASAPQAAAPAPAIPSASGSGLPTPSFDLPPLDPPTSPSSPGSRDDEE